MKTFLLQSDDVFRAEKDAVRRAVRQDASGEVDIRKASLAEIQGKKFMPLPQAVPVGSETFCRAWMHLCGIEEPEPTGFPECLSPYWGRDVKFCAQYADAPIGRWVEPVVRGAWRPHIKGALRALVPFEAQSGGPVWASQPVAILAEWRAYVSHGVLRGIARRGGLGAVIDETSHPGLIDALPEMIAVYDASGSAPCAYVMDVALLQDRRIALLRVRDAMGARFYPGPCSPRAYAGMLAGRWAQLTKQEELCCA